MILQIDVFQCIKPSSALISNRKKAKWTLTFPVSVSTVTKPVRTATPVAKQKQGVDKQLRRTTYLSAVRILNQSSRDPIIGRGQLEEFEKSGYPEQITDKKFGKATVIEIFPEEIGCMKKTTKFLQNRILSILDAT